jgi:hypothetical protein
MAAGTINLPSSSVQQRWFVAALLLFFVGLSVQYSIKVLGKESGSAIVRWHNQLHELIDGGNPYEGSPYPNPPIMAILLTPFALVEPLTGALCWYYLKVSMTLLAVFWVFQFVEAPDRPFPAWAKAAVVLLSLRPIMGDLIHGNVNLFILFLVVAAMFAFRKGRDVAAGLILGLAIACKVTPALFVPYFIWKRAWKTLAGCGVGLVLFFWLVPGLFLGQRHNAELLRTWADNMVKPFLVQGLVFYSEHNNQSLPGVVLRLTTHSPSFSTYVGDQNVPTQYHNLLDLDARLARWLIKGCMGAFALVIVWSCRTPTERRAHWRLSAEMGLVLLGMLLFSERTWKHHCVMFLVPIAVICYYLCTYRAAWTLRAFLVGSLVAVEGLMATTSTLKVSERWDHFAKLSQVYGAYLWACILLGCALVVLLRQPEPEACPSR